MIHIEQDMNDAPNIFETRRDYRFDSFAIEDGHSTATEVALYLAIGEAAKQECNRLGHPLVVADLCSATGGASTHALSGIRCKELHLVDIEPKMIVAAAKKEWDCKTVNFHTNDAITWNIEKPVDLFLANSAYHHISDDRKIDFLRNIARQLSPDGRILVGEHFLPAYDINDFVSYRKSVYQFYSERISFLEKNGDSKEIVDVIRQTGYYCWIHEYEYQVSKQIFLEHCGAAGLAVSHQVRLWPSDNSLPESSGTFLIVLRR